MFIFFASSSAEIVALLDHFGVDWQLLIIQIINFVLVSFILYKFAFKPVLKTMDERRKKINDGLEYSKKMQSELMQSSQQCNKLLKEASVQANDIIRDARDNAEKLNAKQIEEARRAADSIIENTRTSLAAEKDKMLVDVKSNVKSLIIDLSEKILQKNLSDDEKSKFSKDIVELMVNEK